MNERRPTPSETILSERDAKQLLARASELDAALRSGTSIATLRAAAAEAGIASAAFDAALAEAQARNQAQTPHASARSRPTLGPRAAAAALGVLAIITVGVTRTVMPSDLIERSLPVRCLSQEDALASIRPYLNRTSTAVATPGSRMLRVRGTAAQIDRIQSALDDAERSARTCVSR